MLQGIMNGTRLGGLLLLVLTGIAVMAAPSAVAAENPIGGTVVAAMDARSGESVAILEGSIADVESLLRRHQAAIFAYQTSRLERRLVQQGTATFDEATAVTSHRTLLTSWARSAGHPLTAFASSDGDGSVVLVQGPTPLIETLATQAGSLLVSKTVGSVDGLACRVLDNQRLDVGELSIRGATLYESSDGCHSVFMVRVPSTRETARTMLELLVGHRLLLPAQCESLAVGPTVTGAAACASGLRVDGARMSSQLDGAVRSFVWQLPSVLARPEACTSAYSSASLRSGAACVQAIAETGYQPAESTVRDLVAGIALPDLTASASLPDSCVRPDGVIAIASIGHVAECLSDLDGQVTQLAVDYQQEVDRLSAEGSASRSSSCIVDLCNGVDEVCENLALTQSDPDPAQLCKAAIGLINAPDCPVGGGPISYQCVQDVIDVLIPVIDAPECPVGGGAVSVQCLQRVIAALGGEIGGAPDCPTGGRLDADCLLLIASSAGAGEPEIGGEYHPQPPAVETIGYAPPDEVEEAIGDPLVGVAGLPRAKYKRIAAGYESFHKDPHYQGWGGATVTLAQVGLDFQYGGGCVRKPYYHGYDADWVGHWVLDDIDNEWNKTCAEFYQNILASFYTDAFAAQCAGRNRTKYDRTWLIANADGSLESARNPSKSGGCSPLLHFHWRLLRLHPVKECVGQHCEERR